MNLAQASLRTSILPPSGIARAAQSGYPEAQLSLGRLYQAGLSITPDPAAALRLYLLAAEKGNLEAIGQLAKTFEKGIGVKPDPAQAYFWTQITALRGDDFAQRMQTVAESLSPAQLTDARRNAAAWMSRHQSGLAPSELASRGESR